MARTGRHRLGAGDDQTASLLLHLHLDVAHLVLGQLGGPPADTFMAWFQYRTSPWDSGTSARRFPGTARIALVGVALRFPVAGVE